MAYPGLQKFMLEWFERKQIGFVSYHDYKSPDQRNKDQLWFKLNTGSDKPFWHLRTAAVHMALRGQLNAECVEGRLETMLRSFSEVIELQAAEGPMGGNTEARKIVVSMDGVSVKRMKLQDGSSLTLIRVRPVGGKPGFDQLRATQPRVTSFISNTRVGGQRPEIYGDCGGVHDA